MTNQPYFLERVAQSVLDAMKDHKKVAIILPNRRPAVYIKKYMAQRIDNPIFLPDILTIEEFFFNVTGLLKADYTQQLILLYQAYKEAKIGSDTIEEILGWAPTFISDCNDIDNSLAEPNKFFEFLFEEKELRNWNLGEDLTSMQIDYLNFWENAPRLYAKFTELLLDHKSTYSGLSYRIGVKQLEEKWDVPYDKMMFVGFNALNNAEEKLIDLSLQNECGEIHWDYDGYYLNDYMLKAGDYFRKYIDKWSLDANADTITGYRNERINIIKAPNTVAQTDVVYSIVKKACKDKTQEQLRNTAIILCDEKLLEPTLLRLPEEYTYNITMGKPLKTFGQFHLFDNIINLFQDKRSKGFTSDSLMNLINSPYIDLLDQSKTGVSIQKHIIENNQYYITPDALSDIIKSDKNIWHRILNCTPEPIAIFEMSLHIIERLRAYYLDNKDRGSIEIIYEFRNLLVNLINIGKEYPAVLTLRTMRKLYQKVVGQSKIPYEGEPVEGIQIMGLLESRTLDFEHIILVSANESILPESKSSQSFIPYIFKKHFGMPTYNERDAIFAYSFYRLLHHTQRMDIIYGDSDAGELSRYVEQVCAEYNTKANQPTKITKWDAVFDEKDGSEWEYVIPKTDKIISEIKDFIKNKTFSPSSMNTLINSPLDFYFSKIARIKEPKSLEVSIQANTFGTILHRTLESLYEHTIGRLLTEADLDMMDKNMENEYQKFIQDQFKGGDISSGHNYMMIEAGRTMIKEALKFDRERLKSGDEIKIIGQEEELHSDLTLDINGTPMTIKLYGDADRIQEANGNIEIIDYKSGTVRNSSGNIKWFKPELIDKIAGDKHNPKVFQLLTYCQMSTNRTTPDKASFDLSKVRPAIQSLRSWQDGLIYIGHKDYEITTDHLETYREQLSKVFTDLLDPNIPFTPEEDEKKTMFSDYKDVWES